MPAAQPATEQIITEPFIADISEPDIDFEYQGYTQGYFYDDEYTNDYCASAEAESKADETDFINDSIYFDEPETPPPKKDTVKPEVIRDKHYVDWTDDYKEAKGQYKNHYSPLVKLLADMLKENYLQSYRAITDKRLMRKIVEKKMYQGLKME